MTAVRAWLRLDTRRRWRSLLVMALLVALAAGTVMTALSGARRGTTAIDRLVERTLPATIAVLPNQAGFDWDAVRALPEVAGLTTFVLTGAYVVDELPQDSYAAGFPPGDDEVFRTIERPVVLDGRLPDPARADEVVVSRRFEETYGLGVGDAITLRLFSPETQDSLPFASTVLPEPDGPVVDATIVGIIRSPWFSDVVGDSQGGLSPSPGLFAQYRDNLLGASGQGELNALVRLRGGEADVASFKAGLQEVSGRSDIDFMDLAEDGRHLNDVLRFEADALQAFALAAGAAAIFLVGQAVARYAASAAAELQVARALGMTVGQSTVAAAAGPVGAAVAGTLLGAAGAVVASRWFPVGTAALFEPDPGFDVDPLVIGGIGAATVLLAAAGAGIAARLALRSARTTRRGRPSALAAAARRAGAPVPVVVGARFALEPGRGRQAVPVRPALVGAVVGVLGVIAAFTFSDGVEDAADHPERFGQVYQLASFVGDAGEDFGPVDQVLSVFADDPQVRVVNDTRVAVAVAESRPVTLFTLDQAGREPLRPVLVEGRAPEQPGELVLAPGSADALDVGVGDVVTMSGTAGDRDLTVTGLAFVPEGPHNNYVTGGWVTGDGFDTLFDPASTVSPAFKYHLVLLGLEPGADPMAVMQRLEETVVPVIAAATGEPPESITEVVLPVEPPSRLAELRQVRTLPVFLAGFLAVLALGAVGHALATAVRRRRHEVAVLRALGMTRWQSRWVVVTQASLLALIGLAIGVPLGLALGRTVWRYVAETTPLLYVAPLAALALLLVVPLALVAANLLAAWPSHRAAALRVGSVLRAE
ncbi:ABC transporter permease [Jiangella alkaliphila]|uniref:MacB-like core domain-containing protein n=1 Tax=Jiangella alkaliphila TaxID=419479 RepID=A0A1H2M7U3_9ACTN|nr:FtsX-like permease family protein [Jiangella alkaliphila]SDU89008.1 MacB-like core domain-containing protein [Jiangella alkaliphila]